MPKAGDFGLTNIKGPLGFCVGMGQLMLRDSSRYTHAFILVDAEHVVEARPLGAKLISLNEYSDRKTSTAYSNYPLTEEQRHEIVMAAISLIGTPYSFVDYLSLALVQYGLRPKWLTNYVSRKDRLICSQLCDEAYRRAGVQLFKDGRLSCDVTPGDLGYLNFVVHPEQ